MTERQKVSISGNNPLRLGRTGAFKDSIVRFVFEDMEGRTWAEHCCDLTDFLYRLPNPLFFPLELRLKHSGGFCQDGYRGIQFEFALDSFKIGCFSVAAGKRKSRNIDVRVKDDAHGSAALEHEFFHIGFGQHAFLLCLFHSIAL